MSFSSKAACRNSATFILASEAAITRRLSSAERSTAAVKYPITLTLMIDMMVTARRISTMEMPRSSDNGLNGPRFMLRRPHRPSLVQRNPAVNAGFAGS